MIDRTLADSLDALHAGIDSDSGIRDPELLAACVAELHRQAEDLNRQRPSQLNFLDIAWDLSVELYGKEPYAAEDRWTFIQWVCEEAGWDLP